MDARSKGVSLYIILRMCFIPFYCIVAGLGGGYARRQTLSIAFISYTFIEHAFNTYPIIQEVTYMV